MFCRGRVTERGLSRNCRDQECSWKNSRMEDEKSLPCKVWGLMVQARSVVLRSPEDRISVGIVRASFPRGREDLCEALFFSSCIGSPKKRPQFPHRE